MADEIQRRRRHSDEFKARLIEQCRTPGLSIASVALANGLNANLLRRWINGRGCGAVARQLRSTDSTPTAFVQIAVAERKQVVEVIRIEVQRGNVTVRIDLPQSAMEHSAGWLRELMR